MRFGGRPTRRSLKLGADASHADRAPRPLRPDSQYPVGRWRPAAASRDGAARQRPSGPRDQEDGRAEPGCHPLNPHVVRCLDAHGSCRLARRVRRRHAERAPGRPPRPPPHRPTTRTRRCRRPRSSPGCRRVCGAQLGKTFTGDLDGMVARRMIRVGATFNRTFYFVDNGVQRGVGLRVREGLRGRAEQEAQDGQCARSMSSSCRCHADVLARALTEGKVDLVVAQVTVRPELQALVDFTNPTRTNVSEVVVTGPSAPAIASPDDLSGKDVYARKDSKYYESLVALNGRLKAKGKAPAVIQEIPGNLEDDDVLEMVNADLIPITVVDDYMAEFWKKVFTEHHRPQDGDPPYGRESRRAHPQGQPEARRRAQRVPGEVRPRDGVRQHDGEAVSRKHEVREAGHLRSRAEEVLGTGRGTSRSTAASTRWTTC